MARPRQPVELLLVKGNKHLTKEEIEDRKSTEVKAASDKVRAPSYLPQGLRREFKRIADELVRIEIMTNLDIDALAGYLMAREQHIRVHELLRETDPLHQAETYKELLNSQDKLFKQIRSSASDLGLTISSRCRLVIPKKEDNKPKSEEEQMFGDAL